jgi:multiple sugar transport system permease protein
MRDKRSNWRTQDLRLFWLLAAPAFILLLMFIVTPSAMAFVLSFTDQRLVPNLNIPTRFVVWRNYLRLWDDAVFHRALFNNLYFAAIVVPTQTVLGLLLALLVNQKLRFIAVFRTIYFSPIAITTVVISIIWENLYSSGPDGDINQLIQLVTFGLVGPQNWLRDTRLALPAIMLLSIWQGVGLQMTIYLAGLQNIPESIYEAAQIDGANKIQQFFYIVLPQLRNTTLFVLTSTTILAFRLFTPIEVLTGGGPFNATMTMIFYTYKQGFKLLRIGYASAITVIFFLVILGISFVQRAAIGDESKRHR